MFQHSSTFSCGILGMLHARYKELKQQDLTWEQFLTEVTVMDDEEAWWDSSKLEEDDKGRHLPSSCDNDRKHVKVIKKSQEVVFLIVLKIFKRN